MFVRMFSLAFMFVVFLQSCQKLPKEAQLIQQNKVSGTIDVDSKLKGKCDGFLFIIVRKPESPQPLAVKRIKNPEYPYNFVISPADVMIENYLELFSGDLLIYAKTSKSGNPFEESGYCESEILNIKAGSKDIKILLDSYQEQR